MLYMALDHISLITLSSRSLHGSSMGGAQHASVSQIPSTPHAIIGVLLTPMFSTELQVALASPTKLTDGKRFCIYCQRSPTPHQFLIESRLRLHFLDFEDSNKAETLPSGLATTPKP